MRISKRVSRKPPHTEAHRDVLEEGTVRIPQRGFPSSEQRARATSAFPKEPIADRPRTEARRGALEDGTVAPLNVLSRTE